MNGREALEEVLNRLEEAVGDSREANLKLRAAESSLRSREAEVGALTHTINVVAQKAEEDKQREPILNELYHATDELLSTEIESADAKQVLGETSSIFERAERVRKALAAAEPYCDLIPF